MSAARLVGRSAGRIVDLAAAVGFTGWLAATALSQHPNRSFDRLRKFDRAGVAVPNWRFFAPEPATHDFRVMHRCLLADGTTTEWAESNVISPRRWRQTAYYPERRRDKAMSDICNEIIGHLHTPGQDLSVTPSYRMLRDFVGVRLAAEHPADPAPKGFQLLVVSDCGYDEDEDPQYLFASRFEPWMGAGKGAGSRAG